MSYFTNEYDDLEKVIYENGLKIKVLHVHPDLDLMLVVLNNGKVLHRTISASKWLQSATLQQLHNYRLIGQGAEVHWEGVDEDLSLKSFLKEEINRSIQKIRTSRVA